MTVYQVTHLAAPHLPRFCPDHILLLSVTSITEQADSNKESVW